MAFWRLASAYCFVIITHCCCLLVSCIASDYIRDSTEGCCGGESKDTTPAKNPCQRYGCSCEGNMVNCVAVNPDRLDQRILELSPDARSISFTKCSQEHLDLHIFSNFTSLRSITVRDCGVQRFTSANSIPMQNLHILDLSFNYLWDWNEVCQTLNKLSSLKKVDLSHNLFTDLSHTGQCMVNKLQYLNLSFNRVSELSIVPNAAVLDLSSNDLTRVLGAWPSSLSKLNLSNNPSLERFPSLTLVPHLTHLNMDGCELTSLPLSSSSNLRLLSLQNNKLPFVDFNSLRLPSLQELDLTNSLRLHSVVGMLPSKVKDFRLTNTPLRYLPSELFMRSKSLHFVKLMPNNWSCDNCLLKWTKMLPPKLRPRLDCANVSFSNCSIGISKRVQPGTKYFVRVHYGETAILPCDIYGEPPLTIDWWLVRPEILIGSYDAEKGIISMNWTRNNTYEIIPGGPLLVQNARKEVVERYRCIALNLKGNASQIVHFRLDYSSWYHLAMAESVFWGSILAAVITCAITFVLNLLWIICRQIGLWWIKRIERNKHVREMVAAMERYRQRQMTMLSEAYHKKLEQVRENYHQQVEQLRASYTSQSERFRDYRAAQMESMNQHLENIRDNYNQQKCKIRDYGLRRVEQLWEGYERQVNRLKMFSLQQRLGLTRKYKVKQRYVNALFEKFAGNPPPAFMKPHPEVIFTEPLRELDIEMHRRIGSFHSLPEYVLRDEDVLSTVQSELFHEFCNRKPFLVMDDDTDDDAPCTSQQPQIKRSSIAIELTSFHRRYSLSSIGTDRDKSTTLNLHDENEPLQSDNTSLK